MLKYVMRSMFRPVMSPVMGLRSGPVGPVALYITGTPSAATYGVPYSWTPAISGGTAPYTVTVTTGTLPAWASLNAATGAITGTPDDTTQINVTLTVTDDVADTAARPITINVNATVPSAPLNVAATAGNAEVTVTFDVPASDGGSAITGYRVTSTPGGITATGAGSPITVTGLTNGVEYTFTVAAENAIGYGPESAASNAVTPEEAPSFTPITATGGTVTDVEIAGRLYRLHTFTSSADFVVSDLGDSGGEVEYFLLGSGGGGAHNNTASNGNGGGSAGELKKGSMTLTVGTFPAVVPAGGAGVAGSGGNLDGSGGSAATFNDIAALGGVGGARLANAGKDGFHGSGAGSGTTLGVNPVGGVGTSTRNGGDGYGSAAAQERGGGGGAGMAGNGGSATNTHAGNGGPGVNDDFDGVSTGYAGGGGGGSGTGGVGGTASHGGGPGGVGNASAGVSGTANRGGGGGGGGGTQSSGNGGSGLVMIRYPLEAA